jgi:hypothetical protein
MAVEIPCKFRPPKPQDGAPPLTFALQSLLARHEAYMASAERDRVELTARIEQLEHENLALEARNKQVVDENQSLRDELEHLNESVTDADTKIEALEATLRDSMREVRRLESATERAAVLERQIALLEEEQATLQSTLVSTQEEARSAMYRWRQAERRLYDLQEQLERMEKEAKAERERHVEVMGRMEKQRVVEKELNTAAGRLKGAAAVKSMTDSRNGGGVVSHFVRDLLQDNATLQLGIAELRELLMSSNDEIQMLREQLMYHQPAESQNSTPTPTLRTELEQTEPPTPLAKISQELHIHHHYHISPKPEPKKPKKKRHVITSGTFSPPAASVPSTPISHAVQKWQHRGAFHHSPQHSSSTISIPSNNRWSIMSDNPSDFTPSSAPSSPQSNPRNSVFDRSIVDLSLPNSPTTSIDPMSPTWQISHKKHGPEASTRSLAVPGPFPNLTSPIRPQGGPHPLTRTTLDKDTIEEEQPETLTGDDGPDAGQTTTSTDEATVETSVASETEGSEEYDAVRHRFTRGPRRMVSHESIMSLSNGMDIHTLKARPSQMSLRPLGLTTAGTNVSAVTARPILATSTVEGKRGSAFLRDNLATVGLGLAVPKESRNGNRVVSNPMEGGAGDSNLRAPVNKLSKLVSWRLWGGSSTAHPSPEPSPVASPMLTSTEVHAPPAAKAAGGASSPEGSLPSSGLFRSPGINQPGGIPGFYEYWAAHQRKPPSKVTVDSLGQIQEAMREVLEE